MVKQLPFKELTAGSNPAPRTTMISKDFNNEELDDLDPDCVVVITSDGDDILTMSGSEILSELNETQLSRALDRWLADVSGNCFEVIAVVDNLPVSAILTE